MRLISARDLSTVLPLRSLIPLMRDAFSLISGGRAPVAKRQALTLENGTGLLMGAATEGQGIAAKLVTVMPANRVRGLPGSIGLLVLMDAANGAPLALIDGVSLTARRTAALNACAIDLLARPESRVGVLIGCGTQAQAQLDGLLEVRALEQVRVFGRNPAGADVFVERNSERVGTQLVAVPEARPALEGTDIVVAATNSTTPVFSGGLIPDGCHVSGIGSFRTDMREFDVELLSKASIFVESRQTAAAEAGELIHAETSGVTAARDWAEIGEVLDGARPGRRDKDEITFFKSVGHALFDLLAARAAWQAALDQDAGQEWEP